jgi:putative oxidoreductase
VEPLGRIAPPEQEMIMSDVARYDTTYGTASRYYIPAFGLLYARLRDVSWLILRAVVGLNLVPHGMQKAFGAFNGPGVEGFAGALAKMGYPAPTLFAWLVMLTELVGGILIAAGFLTRPAALALLIFMATAVYTHFPRGFFWTTGGLEYPLMWGAAAFFFLVHGGGPYSVDRALGKEF